LTLDCLESLDRLTYGNIDVIVVDNASTDGTAAVIEERYGGRITTLVNRANLGFSEGNNVGIRHAIEGGADYILLLNNDTLVDPNLVDQLVEVISKTPEIGIVGPKIYYASPPDQIWFAGGEVHLFRGTARHIQLPGVLRRRRFLYARKAMGSPGCVRAHRPGVAPNFIEHGRAAQRQQNLAQAEEHMVVLSSIRFPVPLVYDAVLFRGRRHAYHFSRVHRADPGYRSGQRGGW
jgi:glycosyltransferase involved in cell wall biosynthesis